jgi:hypothetical protein
VNAHGLEALDRILEQEGDVDDVLRSVVHALVAEPAISWARISFLEEGRLVPGPEEGLSDEAHRMRIPVLYGGSEIGELAVDGDVDRMLLERVATLLSTYVLIGWDTGGESWEP